MMPLALGPTITFTRVIRHFRPMFLGVLLFHFGSGVGLRADQPEPAQVLGVLAAGYSNNREAFQSVDCRFEVVSGTLDREPDSVHSATLARETFRRKGHWLVNNSLERYELLCEPQVVKNVEKQLIEHHQKQQKEKGPIGVDCIDTVCVLERGKYALSYSSLALAANIATHDDRHLADIRYTPFSMGVMGPCEFSSPSRYILDALGGRWKWRYIGIEKSISGRDMMVCTIGPNGRVRLGFDPERNYMLVMMSDTFPDVANRVYVAHVLDAKECSNGAWFPTNTITVWEPDGKTPHKAEAIRVQELETDQPPEAARFALDIDAHVQISHPPHHGSTTLQAKEHISVTDLPALHQRCIENGRKQLELERQGKEAMKPNLDGGLASPRLKWLIAFNVVVVVLLGAMYIAYRRLKKRGA